MKIFLFIAPFLLFISPYLFSDDSFYFASGDNLFPLQNSKIALTYEKLEFKKATDAILVKVYLELSNSSDEQESLIGFETPPERIMYQLNKVVNGTDLAVSNTSGIEDFKVFINNEK